jgi:hypothetical protein
MAHSISMAEIKRRYYSAVGGHNNHWFDASTRRFFNDRLPTQGWEGPGGVFFYHSIQFHGSDGYVAPRQYKVVKLVETGPYPGIDTTGSGAGTDYASAAEANAVARRYADAGVERRRTPHPRTRRDRLTVAEEKSRRRAQARTQGRRADGRFK